MTERSDPEYVTPATETRGVYTLGRSDLEKASERGLVFQVADVDTLVIYVGPSLRMERADGSGKLVDVTYREKRGE